MKRYATLARLRRERRTILLAAGFFDGVHRGHQGIIRKLVNAARREGGAAWVMTFDTHPLKILAPSTAPRLLTSTAHKLQLLKALGIDGCVVIRFTLALARREPEEFIARLVRSAPTLRRIVVGRNWTFGRQGRGTSRMLKALAATYGFKVSLIPPVRWKGKVVSSTRIRAAVLAGELEQARGMLGRRFSLLGTVVSGRGLGRKLGIPTANLDPHNEALPPDGVYIVRARWNAGDYPGIVNLGIRPTVRPAGPTVPERVLELHLIGLRRNLYGKAVEITFFKKLRRERAFPSLAELRRQIQRDIQRAQAWWQRGK
ncbi:MAG: bifunctional riboflavin kinase/FAD synthetase [Lentisphaerae bacterium]|nr:bifunctional riboflavin kinase/FAD synthetase [Lentisphaerota bacterium]